MKPSKQFMQLGFKKKQRHNKQNISDCINKIIAKQNTNTFNNTTQTDYLLSTETCQKHKKQNSSFIKQNDSRQERRRETIRQKPPLRKRLQSFEQTSMRMYSKSLIQNSSHRSRSKSKIDEKLDEMLINQRVKQQLIIQKKSQQSLSNKINKTEPLKNKLNLNKSIRQATLSKYINQLTQEAKSERKENQHDKNEEFVINQLSNIVGMIDAIFGVNKSEKLVSSYRDEKCLSVHSLIATIKLKLESAGKGSGIKSLSKKDNS